MLVQIRVVLVLLVFVLASPAFAAEKVAVSCPYLSNIQPVQRTFKELTLVAANDIVHPDMSMPQKIDMPSRQQYFAPEGWADYQAYVSGLRKQIDLKFKDGAGSLALQFDQAECSKNEAGQYFFSVPFNLFFCYYTCRAYMSWGKLDVAFTLNEQGQPLISRWRADPDLEPLVTDLRCGDVNSKIMSSCPRDRVSQCSEQTWVVGKRTIDFRALYGTHFVTTRWVCLPSKEGYKIILWSTNGGNCDTCERLSIWNLDGTKAANWMSFDAAYRKMEFPPVTGDAFTHQFHAIYLPYDGGEQ